ncbi:hypothetical protein ACVNF4_10115 [Streptomyces sp. S6]
MLRSRLTRTAGSALVTAALVTGVSLAVAAPASAEKAVCIYYNPYTGEYSNGPFTGVVNQTYYDPTTGTYSNSC